MAYFRAYFLNTRTYVTKPSKQGHAMKKLSPYPLILLICVLMILGCVETGKRRAVWQPVKPERSFFVHTVQWPEERLDVIAKWYTGDSDNQQALADANPNIDPVTLSLGDKIFISEGLLKTREPMPADFMDTFDRKPKTTPAAASSVQVPVQKAPESPPPAPLPQKEEEFEIIGPK
jgi:hypothetical protein